MDQMTVAYVADTDMTVQVQFSPDGTNIDSTLTYTYTAGVIDPPHRLIVAREFFRVIATNSSGGNQSYLRLQTSAGDFGELTSPLNATVAKGADSIIVRAITLEDEISLGKYADYSITQKFGVNTDISSSGNEDVWNSGGVYAGFPTGSPEEFEIVLSDMADIGADVTFRYLASSTSTDWVTATITTTGTSTSTGITGFRSSRGIFDAGGSVNAGTVTLRHVTTTANIFWVIPIGKCQTRVACDSVPAG